jgi:hypothetical protein
MAGNTAVISMMTFATDWAAHVPISALCERYTVTKDQVLRLKTIWQLAPRHDRRLRQKPKWAPRPTRAEDAASGSGCELAPEIARRIEELRSRAGRFGTLNETGVVEFSVPVIATGHLRNFRPSTDENGNR